MKVPKEISPAFITTFFFEAFIDSQEMTAVEERRPASGNAVTGSRRKLEPVAQEEKGDLVSPLDAQWQPREDCILMLRANKWIGSHRDCNAA